jgi:hypothetical protein
MKKEELIKARRTAAMISAAIISAVFLYAAVVEAVSRFAAFSPPVTGTASAVLRYALYFLGVSAVLALRFVRPAMESRRNASPDAAARMLAQAVVTSALCEVPALAGFMLFVLTGGYWDFYLLASFSTVMELINFPTYREWEDKIRNGCGLTLE